MMRVFLGLVVLAGAAWLGKALFDTAAGPVGDAPQQQFNSSSDCRPCHEEVYAEWEQSWHALSWVDPDVRAESQRNLSIGRWASSQRLDDRSWMYGDVHVRF